MSVNPHWGRVDEPQLDDGFASAADIGTTTDTRLRIGYPPVGSSCLIGLGDAHHTDAISRYI